MTMQSLLAARTDAGLCNSVVSAPLTACTNGPRCGSGSFPQSPFTFPYIMFAPKY